jgi:DHA1 family inner membrane transport protein
VTRTPLPILALALAAFAIGTTEFVIMGLLPEVAADLGVSISRAGLLVTGYALGVACGAPLVAAVTARWPPRATLLALMATFIAGNVVSASAPTFALLMIGRVGASFAHGSFFGRGAVVASNLVEPARRAGAVALMFTGLTVANVLGVPLGTWVGHQWGWRATFWGVALSGTGAFVAVAALIPATLGGERVSRGAWRVVRDPRVASALLLTTLGFGGVFVAFTFITPILVEVRGLSPQAVTAELFLFGAGITVGNVLGGRLADRYPGRSMVAILAALCAIQLVLAAVLRLPVLSELALVAWGTIAFATVPGLQLGVVEAARAAPTIASTLNIAAFNLGNAGGALLGAKLLDAGAALRVLPVVGSAIAVVACLVASARSGWPRRPLAR